MRKLALGLAIVVLLAPHFTRAAAWLTDLPTAQAQASSENKVILVNFTGSDWCGWCIRLRKEVFSRAEFIKFADENLVLVEIDFPRGKTVPQSQREANQALAQRFGVEGFPTVVLLNSQGAKLDTLGYEEGGAANYVKLLSRFTGKKENAPTTARAVQTTSAPAPKPGVPATPSVQPDELVLKGISGSKDRRLALINDQTFAAGEAGIVQCGNRREKIRCVEIRDKSVIIFFAGTKEQKEIRLRSTW